MAKKALRFRNVLNTEEDIQDIVDVQNPAIIRLDIH